jgi:thiol-disulfide isomerase/thioredoxin
MKLRSLLFLVSVLFAPIAAMASGSQFSLKGNIPDKQFDGLYIYMIKNDIVDYQKNRVLDSCLIKDGQFSFTRNVAEGESPYVVTLSLPPKNEHFTYGLPECYCIVEGGAITVNYTPLGEEITGGTVNAEYDSLVLKDNRQVKQQVDAVTKQRDQLEKGQGADLSLQSHFNQIIDSLYKTVRPDYIKFISRNIHNDAGAYFFFNYPSLNYPQETYAALSQEVNQDYVRSKKAVDEQRQQERSKFEQSIQATNTGRPYRDFEAPDIHGKLWKLSGLIKKGHVTLIDFWASWCVPCIQELPVLKKLYAAYHDKGFDIVSFSFDTRKASWLNAVSKHQMTWTQLSDLKGWKSQVAKDYGISAIPFLVVVDQNGKIAVKNMHGDKLASMIEGLMNDLNNGK